MTQQDRPSVVATTILAIIAEALGSWIRGGPATLRTARNEIETYLRDEFADCAREARGDHELIND